MGLMNIKFNDNEIELQQLQDVFNELGEDALYYSHYELASATDYSASDWKLFLTDPRVQDFLELELSLNQQTAIRKMMRDIDQSRSTGQAQLLNTLVNQSSQSKKKEGPIFIYTYIPLNKEEEYAPNVQIAESDPFEVRVTN